MVTTQAAMDWAGPLRGGVARRRVVQMVQWWLDPALGLDPPLADDAACMARLAPLIGAWAADAACAEEAAQLQAVYAEVCF
jgi:hypothetical protein